MTASPKNRPNPQWLGTLLVAAALWFGAHGFASADSQATVLTRQQWHELLAWETQDCPVEPPSSRDAGVHVFALSSKLNLIQIDCRRLAYQATYYFYLQKGKSITRQVFQQFESSDGPQLESYSAPLVTGLPSVKPAAQALFVLRKYRGYGDCGQYLEYRLDGRRLALKQLRVNECAQTLPAQPSPPQNWPVRQRPAHR